MFQREKKLSHVILDWLLHVILSLLCKSNHIFISNIPRLHNYQIVYPCRQCYCFLFLVKYLMMKKQDFLVIMIMDNYNIKKNQTIDFADKQTVQWSVVKVYRKANECPSWQSALSHAILIANNICCINI